MDDLREFINKLRENDELISVKKEVSLDYEIGAITRRVCEVGAEAPLFENIKEAPGWRILGNPHSRGKHGPYARLNIGLGLPRDTPLLKIIDEYFERRKNLIKPVTVKTGPCKENKMIGPDVDLYKLPAPLLHGGDGGKYISTWSPILIKDPESDWVNWGMYRQHILVRGLSLGWEHAIEMGLKPNQILCTQMDPVTHGGMIAAKYEAKGENVPVAVFNGGPPICALVSTFPVPIGISEQDVAGGWLGKPLQLVKCETVDLKIPATSELVMEGEIIKELIPEGPFCEFTGYRGRPPSYKRCMVVKAITHRDHPILTVTNMGAPMDTSAVVSSVCYSAEVTRELKERGFPIKLAYMTPASMGAFLTVISTKVPYYGYTKILANAYWSTRIGSYTNYLVIVDEDIDPTNYEQVLWAISTRCNPQERITIFKNTFTYFLWPAVTPKDRLLGKGSKILIDATWPKDWPKEYIPHEGTFEKLFPKRIKEKVLQNWKEYGFTTG